MTEILTDRENSYKNIKQPTAEQPVTFLKAEQIAFFGSVCKYGL